MYPWLIISDHNLDVGVGRAYLSVLSVGNFCLPEMAVEQALSLREVAPIRLLVLMSPVLLLDKGG